jgi:hypothetical protein
MKVESMQVFNVVAGLMRWNILRGDFTFERGWQQAADPYRAGGLEARQRPREEGAYRSL